MPNLILHIGGPKTGSSSIQEFLTINRKELKDQKIFIPVFLGEEGHHWLALLAFTEDRVEDLVIQYGLHNPIIRKEERQKKFFQLKHFLEKEYDKDWIISTEILASRLRNEEEIRQLKDLLENLFDKIKIIIYLRNPLQAAISQWSTDVINGSIKDSLYLPEHVQDAFHYEKLIKRWTSVFLDSEFVVRLYQKNSLLENDLIKDFCHYTNISINKEFRIPELVNKKLSYLGLKILREVNTKIPYLVEDGKEYNNNREAIDTYFIKHFSAYPSYKPSLNEEKSYRDFYKISDTWVKDKYFPELDFLWEIKDSSLIPLSDNNEYMSTNEILSIGNTISDIWQTEVESRKDTIKNYKIDMQSREYTIETYKKHINYLEKLTKGNLKEKLWFISREIYYTPTVNKLITFLMRLFGIEKDQLKKFIRNNRFLGN